MNIESVTHQSLFKHLKEGHSDKMEGEKTIRPLLATQDEDLGVVVLLMNLVLYFYATI